MATTLRSYNKRMRVFNSPPVRRSRRKFQYGGVVLNDTGKRNPSIGVVGANDQDTRTTLEGDMPAMRDMPVGIRAYYAEGGAVDQLDQTTQNLVYGPEWQQAGARAQGAKPMPTGRLPSSAATPGSPAAPKTSEAMASSVNQSLRDAGGTNMVRPASTTDLVSMRKGGRMGLRKGMQAGGLVDDEEEKNKLLPGYQGQMEGPPRMPDPQELRRQQSLRSDPNAIVPPSPAEASQFYNPTDPNAREVVAARAETGTATAPSLRGAPMPATTEPSEAEQAMGKRNVGLRKFDLNPATTREQGVAGAPGVTKYRDASGRTLYANTLEDQGRVSTYQSTYAADKAKLDTLIQARLASGHPDDIDKARQLAVTPEQRAMIGDAEQLAGLRARAARGDRGALTEIQGREQIKGLRMQAQAQTANEILRDRLRREPTPLELATFEANQRRLDTQADREKRQDNLTQNTQLIKSHFGDTPEGKAAETRFHQRIQHSNLGDTSTLPPQTVQVLTQASAIMDKIEANKAPGWIGRLFGAQKPQFNELLDMFNKAEVVPARGLFNPYIKTPIGEISKGDVDEGTWRWMTNYVGNLQRGRGGLRGG